MSGQASTHLLDHALGFAQRGWPVFPCKPTKAPATRNGVKDAVTGPEQIRAWWRARPQAMIGVAMGAPSGVFVIDIDVKPGGPSADELLGEVAKRCGGSLPPGPVAVTRSGGYHLYYRVPDGVEVPGRLGLIPHVDVKSTGGYVIAPPSVAEDGKAYRWLEDTEDLDVPVATPAILDFINDRGEESAPSAAPVNAQAAATEAERKYAFSALDNEAGRVRLAGEGTRNQTLNNAALSLGQLVAAGALPESMVWAGLEDAAAACGLTKDDGLKSVKATIASGLKKGLTKPRDLSEIRDKAARRAERQAMAGPRLAATGAPAPPPHGQDNDNAPPPADPPGDDSGVAGEPEDGESLDLRLAQFDRTDLGNARRFISRHGQQFRWCAELGWLAWDGRCWLIDGARDQVDKAVHTTVLAIRAEAEALADSRHDFVMETKRNGDTVTWSDKVYGWGLTSQGNAHIQCIAKLASSYLSVATDDLDADPMKINVLNGTLHVAKRTDEPYVLLKPHNRKDLITKIAGVAYDPDATCPEYDAFLAQVQPSAAVRDHLHRWGGLSYTGDATEQKLHFWYGKGGNGKGVTLNAWTFVAGDYCDTVPIETFLNQGRQRRGGDPTPDLASLAGVRYLRTSEPEKGARLGEALIKLATGEEPMKVRHLNKDLFTLHVQFKLTISGNYRPQITGTDDGIWRRMLLVPWPVIIPEKDRDRALSERLKKEGSGILNRLLDGLCAWLDDGLAIPEEVSGATAEYRADSDPLGEFLKTCTEDKPGERTQSSALYQLFGAWAQASGEKVWSHKGLTSAMRDRGYHLKRSNQSWWLDLTLVKSVDDFEPMPEADGPGRATGPPPPDGPNDYE